MGGSNPTEVLLGGCNKTDKSGMIGISGKAGISGMAGISSKVCTSSNTGTFGKTRVVLHIAQIIFLDRPHFHFELKGNRR